MSAPGKYVLKLRVDRNVSQDAIASATGLCAAHQRDIEGSLVMPSYEERRLYARFFGFAGVQEFDDGWRAAKVTVSRGDFFGRIPVINLAPAGRPQDYDEPFVDSGIGYAYIDPPPGICGHNLFAFIIVGDSMEPDYPEGHYAICRPTAAEEILDGQAVLVRFGESRKHECTFKRCWRVDGEHIELRPINDKHENLTVGTNEVVRLSPVIAVVPPRQTDPFALDTARHIVGDDVQIYSDEISSSGDQSHGSD